jgi:hypothetical protein
VTEGNLVELVADLQTMAPEQAAALEEARRIVADALGSGAPIEQPGGGGEGLLVHRRSLPVFTTRSAASLPSWAAGLRIDRSLGPFVDSAGRHTWIDIFRPIRHVRLVRAAGAAPFLTLPITPARVGPGRRPPATSFQVPAGSIWFASQLLAAAAPVGSYSGLRVTGGTIRFSQPVPIAADEIVVPAAVTIELDVELEQQPAGTGTGPGGDARAAKVAVPSRIRLTITAGGATLETSDTARLLAYGFDTELAFRPGPVRYLPDLHRLAVPFTASSGPFVISQVTSHLFVPGGSAAIGDAAWGLPVAVINPASLGEASGVGSLLLWLDDGLGATWLGQNEAVELGPSVLAVDSSRLSLAASRAHGEHIQQLPLPSNGSNDRIALRWDLVFPVSFFSEASGAEVVLTSSALAASLDKPIDVRGQRLTVHASSIWVAFIATALGEFLLAEGPLDPPSGGRGVAFALVNAVLRATYPNSFVLFGAYDGSKLPSGRIVLTYGLFGILPTLPDPYAASYGSLAALLDQPRGRLLSVSSWEPAGSSFDFVLPAGYGQTGGGTGAAQAELVSGAADPSALMARGQHDLWPDALKALGGALAFERQHGLILLDVSTNVDQFGVAFQAGVEGGTRLAVASLNLELDGRHLLLLTLPAVQWEVLETQSDPDPTFPPRLSFANSGVPSLISVPTVALVPVHPAAALQRIVDNFAAQAPNPAHARFTLPFGIVAQADLRRPNGFEPRGAKVSLNRPRQGQLEGAHQLRIDAVDPSLAAGESPSLPGYTAQLPLGQPGWRSALGDNVTTTFNTYLGAAGARPLVPVTRIDMSGYGESLFSDWRNPYNDPTRDAVAVVQARFDVLIGRTAYEVIQVRSFLFPYAVKVVRTITIERRNNAVVTRHDSGWKAVSDGKYDYPSVTSIITHPGVVPRITNVTHISETGQVLTVDGVDMAAMYFDGDLELDGAPELVGVKDQFGFVQITAGALIGPTTYSNLIAAAGALGGPVAANIHVGGGNQAVQVQRVDVGVTPGLGGPEFAMAAWGGPVFPGGGQWSVLRVDSPSAAPRAVARDRGVPLIRAGAAGTPPPLSSPYRFAEPADLARPTNPAVDYGILHATGTQRVFFPRPKIEATDVSRITSTQIPAVADPYSLAGSLGLFPELGVTLPFASATWALRVSAQGHYRLELPASTFPAGVGRRTMRQAGSVKSDVDYSGAQVTYEVDTAQAVPWRFRLDRVAKIMNTDSLGDIIRVEANVIAAAGGPTTFDQPKILMGGSLGFVQDLLTILADLGISGLMHVDMTNDWALEVAETIPFVDITGQPFQIPPLVPEPDIKFDDTGIKVEQKIAPTNDEATFEIGGQPMFAIKSIPGLYVVAIVKFSIKVSTKDGTTYTLLLGVGLAFDLDAGPFGFKGLLALTFFGFIGDTSLGLGIGFLLQLSVSIDPIISIQISLEGKLAIIWACRGLPAETEFSAGKLSFGVEVSICLVFSISFEVETTIHEVVQGAGEPACALPDVL